MNTIIIHNPYTGILAAQEFYEPLENTTLVDGIESHRIKDALNLVTRVLSPHLSAAWYCTPGSLHGNGEVYRYMNGALVEPWEVTKSPSVKGSSFEMVVFDFDFNKSGRSPTLSDLIIPRGISEDLQSLAAVHRFVYFIRTPAIGLGKLSYQLGEVFAPVLVQPTGGLGKPAVVRHKQKHVSKPHQPK